MSKILIAEDDSTMNKILVGKFNDSGYEVISAMNGKEALDLILKNKPDIILLDIFMPEMNGWEVMENLRKSGDYGHNVKVVVFTNDDADTDDELQKISKFKPSFFIMKVNSSLDTLVEKIDEALKNFS